MAEKSYLWSYEVVDLVNTHLLERIYRKKMYDYHTKSPSTEVNQKLDAFKKHAWSYEDINGGDSLDVFFHKLSDLFSHLSRLRYAPSVKGYAYLKETHALDGKPYIAKIRKAYQEKLVTKDTFLAMLSDIYNAWQGLPPITEERG